MRFSLDSNAYSLLMAPRESLVRCLQGADGLCLSPIVLGELYAGFELGSRYEWNVARLTAFLALPPVEVIPVTHSIAERYGVIVRQLKEQGTPIPTNDIWIAATALETGTRLVSYDAHFNNVPGLIVVSP
ncbi:MAG: type II toxin-antitoxin system VapC family toxin [Armatimonadota bacterium]|jgi:tRNA(fMet)-specific endonuclease VapC